MLTSTPLPLFNSVYEAAALQRAGKEGGGKKDWFLYRVFLRIKKSLKKKKKGEGGAKLCAASLRRSMEKGKKGQADISS